MEHMIERSTVALHVARAIHVEALFDLESDIHLGAHVEQ